MKKSLFNFFRSVWYLCFIADHFHIIPAAVTEVIFGYNHCYKILFLIWLHWSWSKTLLKEICGKKVKENELQMDIKCKKKNGATFFPFFFCLINQYLVVYFWDRQIVNNPPVISISNSKSVMVNFNGMRHLIAINLNVLFFLVRSSI